MLASLGWLNSYLDRPTEADEAERVLTAIGFPVDGRTQVSLSGGGHDIVLDVEVTSNRGDCLSHLGLARELAAATGRVLHPPRIDAPAATGPPAADLVAVTNDEPELCPLYTARLITGLKVGPSPVWLAERLAVVGLHSVNNVVDVTNFVLLETGQPLHAFDLAKLHGPRTTRIVVRRARAGERFVAIDGSRHELADAMLVIADADRVVAVAGVMGGLETEVSDAATDILLESALFVPVSVRRTSRALKLASDSSFRFERGVDPLGVDAASRRATTLLAEVAGGRVGEGVIRAGQDDPSPRALAMRVARCRALLGVDLSPQQQGEYLERLGLQPRHDNGTISCTVPTFRRDLKREVDLIEEVGRLHGFDKIAVRPQIDIVAQPRQAQVAARQQMVRSLIAHGYHETVTDSFVTRSQGDDFLGVDDEPVLIDDESRQVGRPMLRPSLLPSLLVCRKANQDMGNSGLRLFESAASWRRRSGQILESNGLTMLRDADGPQPAVGWAVRGLRGTIEELVERLGGVEAATRLAFAALNEGQTGYFSEAATVKLADEPIGIIGAIAAPTRELFGLKVPLVAAELKVDPLLALYPPSRRVGELARFPGIERDLSVVVAEAVAWQQIEQTVHHVEPAMLEDLRFLGTYRGHPIAPGTKSVSFRMLFRDRSATLRRKQVDPQVQAVIDALKRAVNAELRA